jgi:hypothetical protein
LQQILDQWEIEGKFGHGAHSHVDNNGVDFVLHLIEEIHTADGAQEVPPKEVNVRKGDLGRNLYVWFNLCFGCFWKKKKINLAAKSWFWQNGDQS